MLDIHINPTGRVYRSRLTREQINEIVHYAHIIPVSKGYTAKFMRERYPQQDFNMLMRVFNAAGVLDPTGFGMSTCRKAVAALRFSDSEHFEVEWEAAPAGTSHDTLVTERLDRLYGCGELNVVFGHADSVLCPWARAGRLKAGDQTLESNTSEVLASPIWLSLVDPRRLWASQPRVLRTHAAYYRTGEWERTGVTSADRHVAANRFPVVAPDRLGRLVIRTGHHRALVALVEGRPLLCRLATAPPDGAIAITPTLLVGTRSRLPHVKVLNAAAGVGCIKSGSAVLCDETLAREISKRIEAERNAR